MRPVATLLLLALISALSGCGALERRGSGAISYFVKLTRVVTLYSANGDTIRTWRGRMYLADEGGGTGFMLDGKRVVVSGTYTVEEQ